MHARLQSHNAALRFYRDTADAATSSARVAVTTKPPPLPSAASAAQEVLACAKVPATLDTVGGGSKRYLWSCSLSRQLL